MKILLKPIIITVLLINLSSCKTTNKQVFVADRFIQNSSSDYSSVVFKVNSDRLVYIKKGIEKNALAIKWCRAESRCTEYFYSYHCDKIADKNKCNEIEENFYRARGRKKEVLSMNLFASSYQIYLIKPGTYYLGELYEIADYTSDESKLKSQQKIKNELLKKRDNELRDMAKDSLISKAFFYSGLGLAYAGAQGPGTEVGLVLMAGGGALMLTAMPINGLFTGDFLYITNFETKNGWDKEKNQANLLSFKINPNQTTYIGDITIHLIARGGYFSKRRDGIIDFSVEDNLATLRQYLPEASYKIKTDLAKIEPMAGSYGIGKF